MSEGVIRTVTILPVFLISLCVHEFAHGWIAFRLGDLTPKDTGRLTLNPLAHVDWLGTFLVPTACLYLGFPFIGWAKPVPVDENRLRGGRRSMGLVALAGPVSNIFLAILFTLLLGAVIRFPTGGDNRPVWAFFVASIQVNLMLALFNLIPIPPLDGFMALQSVLPARTAGWLARAAPLAGLILVAFLLTGGAAYLGTPLQYCFTQLLRLIS